MYVLSFITNPFFDGNQWSCWQATIFTHFYITGFASNFEYILYWLEMVRIHTFLQSNLYWVFGIHCIDFHPLLIVHCNDLHPILSVHCVDLRPVLSIHCIGLYSNAWLHFRISTSLLSNKLECKTGFCITLSLYHYML